MATVNGTPLVDSNFGSTNYTSASSLTTATVAEIGTDIATTANAADLEIALCVGQAEAAGATQTEAFTACDTNPPPAPAVTAFTGTVQPGVATAAGSWGELNSLVTQLYQASDAAHFPGGLYSIDGDLSISSTGTVTSKGQPTAYSITAAVSGGATTGYVLPSAFTMTFPNAFTVNTALAGAELPGER